MTTLPRVSVCIVAYNQIRYISDCLESIVTQKTAFPFEILVGDDGSTDGTREVITQYAERYPGLFRLYFYEKNIGSSANYNFIHSETKGEFVAHCDGDDLMLPGKLQAQFDFLSTNPEYAVCWHKVEFFDDAGKTAPEYRKHGISDPGETVDISYALRTGTLATHSSIMYRKSAKKTYNPSYETMDVYFTLEFLMSGKGMILNAVLGRYRVNPTSYSRVSHSRLKMRTLVIEHWKYFYKLMPEQRPRVFIFACINFLVDLKNRRKTAFDFLKLMGLTLGTFSLRELMDSLRGMQYLRLPRLMG